MKRSEILTPLTELNKGGTKKWTPACTKAFQQTKSIIAKGAILAYTDLLKKIYTDASDAQLGAVIMQEGKPLAFYSKN